MNLQSIIFALPFAVAVLVAWQICYSNPAKRPSRKSHSWDLRGDHDVWLFEWAKTLPFFRPSWKSMRRQGE